MQKNFFEYVKELVPEKGSVFFVGENHSIWNGISLYKVADLLNGQKIEEAEYITAYTWKIDKFWDYPFEVIGLMFYKDEKEKWIHFSKNAFIGAICIVAAKNNITFDDEEHEQLRQVWARKIENKETEEDKKITDLEDIESNFDNEAYVFGNSKKREYYEEYRKNKILKNLETSLSKKFSELSETERNEEYRKIMFEKNEKQRIKDEQEAEEKRKEIFRRLFIGYDDLSEQEKNEIENQWHEERRQKAEKQRIKDEQEAEEKRKKLENKNFLD